MRVFEEWKVMFVGDNYVIDLDVCIVVVIKVDLMILVEVGEFRVDFYYCLNLVKVSILVLCDRKVDILLFFKYFSLIVVICFYKLLVLLSSEVK